MFLLYSFIYAIAMCVLCIPQYLRRPVELRRKWLREKFGWFDAEDSPRPIWIHAVSVGEVSASLPLIRTLRSRYPRHNLILSTITDTGQKLASEKVPLGTKTVYLPFDLATIIRRCFRRIRPCMLIVIETELWPNLFMVAADEGIPVIILNGRISEKSFSGYSKVSFFMKKVLAFVRIFGMQGEPDAERLKKLGAEEARISVIGNFKFDIEPPAHELSWAGLLHGPVIVAGSTHSGEEEMILSAYRENLEKFPLLTLILAPRHPERFEEVAELLARSGIPYTRRTELDRGGRDIVRLPHVAILLDSIGELALVYGIADIAVIGKSFIGTGGQNPLEPAYWGKAILCGPHMENFPFIREFYQEGAAAEADSVTLAKKIRQMLVEPERTAAMGAAAQRLFRKYAGATMRAAGILEEYIPDTSRSPGQ